MTPTDKTNKMLVSVVLDRSGSMGDVRAGTISGYNEYINGLRKDTASEYSVSLIQFDAAGSAAGPTLTVSYIDKPLADVPVLTEQDYEPRGTTPLYDAIGECVRRVEPKDRAVTILIITDGMENASREFTLDSVKALIQSKESEGWTFAFLGADIDSYAVSGAMGMSAANTANYAKSNVGATYAAMAQSTMARATLNATVGVGGASTMAFFDDDQKAAMGDPTVKGGQKPAPAGFPKKASVAGPNPGRPGRKPRNWVESPAKH